jgi:hypothetical protein
MDPVPEIVKMLFNGMTFFLFRTSEHREIYADRLCKSSLVAIQNRTVKLFVFNGSWLIESCCWVDATQAGVSQGYKRV